MTLVAGLDQGTSSTRCVVLDAELREVAAASVPVECSFPAPGLVEQDPEAIVASAREAIAATGVRPADVPRSASPTRPRPSWSGIAARGRPCTRRSCGRTAAPMPPARRCASTRRGCASAPGSSSTPPSPPPSCAGCSTAPDGDLAYGDVASWLLHRLAGVHVTDAGNAGRSLLCPLGGGDWDDELLDLFGIPRAADAADRRLRRARRLDRGHPGARRGRRPAGLAVRAALLGARDRQGHARHRRVRARPGGDERPAPAGRHPRLDAPGGARARTSYALEGFVPTAAAAVDWFARIGALPPAQELDALLRERPAGPGLRPRLPGLRQPDLGRRRPRRAVRPRARHHPRRPRAGGDRRHRPPGRRRRRGDRHARRRCASTAASRARTGPRSGSPTSPASPSSARRAPTRPRSAPPPSPASPPACGTASRRSPRSPSTSSPSPRSRRAERDGERERWAQARELVARY